jgi:hypothetical protein
VADARRVHLRTDFDRDEPDLNGSLRRSLIARPFDHATLRDLPNLAAFVAWLNRPIGLKCGLSAVSEKADRVSLTMSESFRFPG